MTTSTLPAPAPTLAGVDAPFTALRRGIRRFVVLEGLLLAALLAAGTAALSFALDYGLFKLAGIDLVLEVPRGVRALALVAGVLAVVAVLVVSIGLRVSRPISDVSLALLLEKRFPNLLGGRLITAVELADVERSRAGGYSAAMVRHTIAEAEERLAQVPLGGLFNWRRLRVRLIALAAMVVLAAAVSGAGFAAAGPTPRAGLTAWADAGGIWAERTLAVRHTPWPRATYLEVLEPTATELRIARDAPAPRVRVKAYDWVVADAGVRAGWRPLEFADAAALGVAAPSRLVTKQSGEHAGPALAAAALAGPMSLPGERPIATAEIDLTGRTLDEVATLYGADHPELAPLIEALHAKAADPAMSRTLRKLTPPEAVTLRYHGFVAGARGGAGQGASRGELKLTREPNGEFTTEVAGLKESVVYTVRANDFRTDPRQVILVPPPLLTRLTRVEYRPAYYYYPDPVDAAPADRKTWLQTMPEKDLSLTGERSIIAIPAGTEMVLRGTTDKPLTSVSVAVRGKPDAPLPPIAVEGDTFTVSLRGAARLRSEETLELTMTDADGVASKRAITVQVPDDQAPTVEVAVDGLRKFGSGYLCTARAAVPFLRESVVRDDFGLARVEFTFDVTRQEASAVVGLQGQAVASIFLAAPLAGGIGSAITPAAGVTLARNLLGDEARQSGRLPVPPHARALESLPKFTAFAIQRQLDRPWAGPEAGHTVRDLKFALDADVFDLESVDAILEKQGRAMLVTDPAKVQPRYRVDVNLVATDANELTGPKSGRNLEPVRLTVVSEADLLAEVTKDEDTAATKFDEALTRLRLAQGKLAQVADLLQSSTAPADAVLSGRVRAEDIAQDVGKGRDLVQAVVGEYQRLLREVRLNRCNRAVGDRYEGLIIAPLEQIQANEAKRAEDALTAYREPLSVEQRPDPLLGTAAKSALAELIRALERVRREIGEAITDAKLQQQLQQILKNQRVITDALGNLKRENLNKLFAPVIAAVPPVKLAPNAKAAVSHAIDWKLFDKGELKLRVEAPAGSGLIVPQELSVKDDRDTLDYEVKAGATPGEYRLRLIPSVGAAVEVVVVVKAP